jgi:hypothetical protein
VRASSAERTLRRPTRTHERLEGDARPAVVRAVEGWSRRHRAWHVGRPVHDRAVLSG